LAFSSFSAATRSRSFFEFSESLTELAFVWRDHCEGLVTIRYLKELAGLSETYEQALQLDVEPLRLALETAAARSAIMVGSGGSFSVASFSAFLHQLNTGRLANASTPLDYMTLPLRDAAVMCISASGRNKDICAAFEEAAQREVKPLIGLVMRNSSPLHKLGAQYRYSKIISASSDHFTDGFLAVGSLVASCVLLLRAYRALIGENGTLPPSFSEFMSRAASVSLDDIIPYAEPALVPTTTSILYSPSLRPSSIDIESRFVEAALGNIQGTDLRNFGHGRHHWFAKRQSETGLVALVGDEQHSLATRTLELIPKSVPKARIDFRGPKDEQALAGLVISLYLAAAAGHLRDIDPAKPGVPEFGRRLYRLAPSKQRRSRKNELVETAVWRKELAGALNSSDRVSELRTHCQHGVEQLNRSRFVGFVFDYDGTLCEPHARFEPLSPAIADGLNRLLQYGALIGIATGRGGSACESIRGAVREEFWDSVVLGLYNGGVICSLREGMPVASSPTDELLMLENTLRSSQHLSGCKFRSNRNQIAVSLPTLEEPAVSVQAVKAIVERAGVAATISCSSHSIDVTFGNVHKTAVVDAIRHRAGAAQNAPVLRMGDKGRWPGNDAELLDDPYGLSVDEVSPCMKSCWGLSPRGILGVQATLFYLDRLNWKFGEGFIHLE
jgi:hydroxymethylpyrimidine pyrophosphatase-like HAD family hydrolase